jgi:hypothetical protein
MGQDEPLKVTHDVSQTLQRKLEGTLAVDPCISMTNSLQVYLMSKELSCM